METKALSYTALVYEEDEGGAWVKLPEFDMQCFAEDWEAGLELLEERLAFQLGERRKKGERVPERLVRAIRRVGREEYGPTQRDIEQQRFLDDLAEEHGDQEDD